ncbi:MAG: tetratricopeptide repeat protein [Planctomycetaceae bacterium]|nr:tetratricopeptide repeat protein [Planctomycetaceae bacterium]MBT6486107.1 tetratricopeptide repeat protein [Planctomycetaceae bacterium]MBT6495604.1 tetratricopeptide repeat protein [Planctomycetaceae bacterium]
MANRGDRAQNRRNQWNDWHGRHYNHHSHWHHGHWHGHWGPGSRWNYWWNRYPVLTAFGVTTWAVNRVGWAFGYNNYYNPYVGDTVIIDNGSYNYSDPLVMTPDETTLAADPDDTSPAEGPSEDGLSNFDTAQKQFYDGNYEAALSSADAALKELPNDAVVHEFRALVLFALGKYPEAAATLYAVLSVGPGWDWTTMSSLYPEVSTYTEQLRKLETVRRANADNSAVCFVLAYHYITCNHKDAAIGQLKQLVKLQPKDQLAANLLQQLDPEAEIPNQPDVTKPPEAVDAISQEQLQGSWQAKRASGETFQLSLDDKGKFNWKFSADGKSQEVRGVYAIDKDGVLALEMNDEGTMLAQLDVKGDKLDFYMLGDSQGSAPLKFSRQ